MLFFDKKRERYKIYGILGFLLSAALLANPQKNFPIAPDYIQNYAAGKEALKMKEYEKAVELFQKSLAQNPNYTDALTGMGIANYEISKEYQKEAAHYFTKTLIIDPKHPEAMGYKGEYFLTVGKLDKTYEYYKTLEKIDLIEAEDLQGSLNYFLHNAQIVLHDYQPDSAL